MKRRLISLLLASAMAVSLTACGSSATGSSSASEAAAGTSQAAEGSSDDSSAADKSSGLTDAPSAILNEAAAVELLSVNANAVIDMLKVDGLENPVGLDDEEPAFSWQMESDVTGAAQKAYQIVVRDSEGNTVWDSGVVESQESTDIKYEGEALAAAECYTWTVAVTDTGDNTVTSEEAYFETGLMSDSKDAWDGAEWIGADELAVDATALSGYKIDTIVEIPEGSNAASIILGADDYRLENSSFNVNGVAGENYVRIELDVSNVTANGGAAINVYRMGYDESDSADTPYVQITDVDDLNELINASNAHEEHELYIEGSSSGYSFTITIDGTTLVEDVQMGDVGNIFPHLGSIGFAANAGDTAVFTDYTVINGGNYSTSTIFDAETGATYAIFEGMDGVTVEGNAITVDGGENGVLGYADPSYAASPMVRTGFEAAGEIASARLYISAQGVYDFYINGEEVAADEWFNPGDSEYDSLIAYNTYDVTDLLQTGGNAMGAILGEGWWSGAMTFDTKNLNYYGDQPALMVKLVVNYADGTSDTIVTDDSWSYYGDGPVRSASFFMGERYDATKEAAVEGWTTADYDASAWGSAAVIETRQQFANQKFYTRTDTPVHVIRTNEVVEALGETREGTDSYIYDMGENVSGVPTITIPEEYAVEGQTITIRFAEILYPELEEYVADDLDGTLMVENYRTAMVTDFYTMKAGEQTYTPDLTFHGYRYIEITGLGQELPAEYIQMQVLSSVDAVSTYESSNELANQLYRNITNSTTSNYLSIPTDCPQRDERMGWTGDAQVFALTGSYIADTYNFLDTWMQTVQAGSGENGMSAQYAPAFTAYELDDEEIVHNGMSFGITWNALAVTIPYNLYMQTGRTDIVESNIDNVYAYVDGLLAQPLEYKDADENKQTESRLTNDTGTLADHLSLVKTSKELLGEAVFIAVLDEAAVLADANGDADIAANYRVKAYEAREAWNELFIDPETGKTRTAAGEIQDTQASYATPLRFNIISDENLEKVVANYNASIAEASGTDDNGDEISAYTLTTGFNATGNVLNALSDNGLNDTAYQLFENTEYASWLYPVTQGATSIWERWNSVTEENGFGGNNGMNSFNHYSYGAVGEWMVGYQAGISANDGNAGYQSFILQPTAGGDYTDLTVTYDTNYGTIVSSWTAADGVMTSYDVTVPANTTATLYLPGTASNADGMEGVTVVGTETHNGVETQVIQLVAGTYHFDM